ncbi:MAG: hypothetical protein HQL99_11185 [Magnetococcales bacterium]|nr:hypothetical protein [Magnetococcales bacterium]
MKRFYQRAGRVRINPGHLISMLLYKTIYKWSREHSINKWYAVITLPYYRILKTYGFPYREINRHTFHGDAVPTLLVSLNLYNAEQDLLTHNKKLFEWFDS